VIGATLAGILEDAGLTIAPKRSCIIDGEAVACDDNGVASFDLVRHQRANDSVFLYAFDLIELNGDDLRRDPLQSQTRPHRGMARIRYLMRCASLYLLVGENADTQVISVFEVRRANRRRSLSACLRYAAISCGCC
jgi:hypothetical protein